MSRDRIDIVCGVDATYVPHLAALLVSIAQTNKGELIRAHILHDGVSATDRQRVAAGLQGIELVWHEVASHQALTFQPLLQITRATYLRLTMAEILPADIQKVLYLDIDIIVNAALRPLWQTDLGTALCAAVVDPGIAVEAFRKRHALPPGGAYFNAGVILFDLAKIRQQGLFQTALTLLAAEGAAYELADQDVLNIVLWRRCLLVDPGWNFQRKFLYNDFSDLHRLAPAPSAAPRIIHFTERQKPWLASEWHPYAALYLRHLSRTDFKAEVLRKGKITLATRVKWRLKHAFRKPAIFR